MRTEEKNMHNNQQGAPNHLLDRFPGAPVMAIQGSAVATGTPTTVSHPGPPEH